MRECANVKIINKIIKDFNLTQKKREIQKSIITPCLKQGEKSLGKLGLGNMTICYHHDKLCRNTVCVLSVLIDTDRLHDSL